ncbi:hypothetical protein [Natrinema versiforme]|uniref:Uncharacterized protein n=1 Tax=Natrinema versiforme TaxID=88724 RepID=A0A4V1FYK1_9EURY|nr:hypothetical protein [Natrinema versiforme]QCS41352.1 hypothetical protein FEJ81_02930 [Natrinema versiforme]
MTDTDSDAGPETETDPAELELSDAEQAALHELQLGIEHVHRAYGTLLEFHHELGHAMDRMSDAEAELREAGHEEWANDLRDDHLPAGAISDQWTFELVEEFSEAFLEEVDAFETRVRDELADGVDHVTERRQKQQLRDRARSEE